MDRNGCQGRSRNRAAREIDALVQRDASDDEFEPVLARLDAYDIRYDDGFNEVYPAYWPTSVNTRPMGNSKDPGLTLMDKGREIQVAGQRGR
jgi:hypothetical protein